MWNAVVFCDGSTVMDTSTCLGRLDPKMGRPHLLSKVIIILHLPTEITGRKFIVICGVMMTIQL